MIIDASPDLFVHMNSVPIFRFCLRREAPFPRKVFFGHLGPCPLRPPFFPMQTIIENNRDWFFWKSRLRRFFDKPALEDFREGVVFLLS